MAQKIDQDVSRFKKIVRGSVKKELRKFISQGELVGKQGKELISIPIPRIEIPHFIYGENEKGGVGKGDGKEGGKAQPGDGEGSAKAGSAEGEHMMEVEVTYEELAELLGEELELPRIEPKGAKDLDAKHIKYTGMSTAGPESLRHFKRTYRKALRRQIISGTYDPKRPLITPVREDRVYRTWKEVSTPRSRALIIYILDVSGSMGNEQKEIVRTESFWIDTVAREVDKETFFHTRESGGTIISSAYKLLLKMIEESYNPAEWNIYPFHFSDGDNWSGNDTEECMKLLSEKIFPISNMFCYGQVESEYGSGQFLRDLDAKFKDNETLVTSRIPDRDAIIDSIKTFLGKGK